MASVPRSQPPDLSQRAHQWGADTKAPENDMPLETVIDTQTGGMVDLGGKLVIQREGQV